jgi:hypothetical protein
MISSNQAFAWWVYVREAALAVPGGRLQVAKYAVPHPRDAGAYVSLGLPAGQDADYRFAPEHDCRGIHVQSFGDFWLVHVDVVHPECSVAEHVRRDAPGAWIAAATAVGGLLGLLLGRRKEAALAGAALGAIVGALTALPDPTVPRVAP